MFKSRRGAERKICVIISDFCVDDPRSCVEKIEEMKKDGVSTIGIGICRASEETVRGFSDYAFVCRRISDLADEFIEVFRRIVFE
jgi:biotin synthase-related radical SAM superfamily protein